MTSVTFLMKDDPFGVDAGDTRVSRLMMEVAAEAFEVRGLALVQGSRGNGDRPIPLRIVPSPPRGPLTALRKNLLSPGRSLLHSYFRVPELTNLLREDAGDVVIAEQTFMAEPAIDAGLPDATTRLLVDTHALQSSVFAHRRSPPLRWIEARRSWRDEVRCVRAASSAACFGEDDLERLRGAGAERLRRLDLLLPPAQRPARSERPRALFFGGRYRWPPNQYALDRLLELWPRIAAEVPGAELVIAGRPAARERRIDDPSVTVTGYVEDLGELLSSSSILLAPVPIGSGVRVKVLDAARHGLPVVGTPEAVGSVGDYLPVRAARSDEDFQRAAVELLSEPERAREAGERLYQANRELWQAGFVHRQVANWIAGSEEAGGTGR
jgi:glycosyltransferase involved in cell wall biosynthesis